MKCGLCGQARRTRGYFWAADIDAPARQPLATSISTATHPHPALIRPPRTRLHQDELRAATLLALPSAAMPAALIHVGASL